MIPLRDSNPSRTFPAVTILLIVLNSAVFFYELLLGKNISVLVNHYGFVPGENIANAHSILTIFTSMFLHGGWMHIIGNMWFLWIFGDNVEDFLGHFRYFAFYISGGAVASLTHFFLNHGSTVPTIGASGAIAAVMGAYFVLYPRARVLTLIPIFIIFEFIEIPAFVFLGIWFLFQFFLGSLAKMASNNAGGVAWWAHFGGFIYGVALLIFLKMRKKRRYSSEIWK